MLTSFIVEPDHNTSQTKNLFLNNLHIRLGISKDCRVDEIRLVAEMLTTKMNGRTLLLTGVHVVHDLLVGEIFQ